MITVIIPSYNYAHYLSEAIDSALAQTLADCEVLVIDDGSTDNTGEIAARYGARIRYHRKENAGLSAARNTGMDLSSNDWVVFLDADDLLLPHALSRLVEVRDSLTPSPAVIGCASQMIDGSGNEFGDNPPSSGRQRHFSATDFALRNRFSPVVLADRRILQRLGGFDPGLKASEDRDMWLRTAAIAPVGYLDERLYRKRDHGANMSRHAARQTESIFRVLEKAAAHPDLALSPQTLREAEAICLYQSARMYLAAGDTGQAARQCLRSIRRRLRLPNAADAGFPPAFRIRFLALLLLGRRPSSP